MLTTLSTGRSGLGLGASQVATVRSELRQGSVGRFVHQVLSRWLPKKRLKNKLDLHVLVTGDSQQLNTRALRRGPSRAYDLVPLGVPASGRNDGAVAAAESDVAKVAHRDGLLARESGF